MYRLEARAADIGDTRRKGKVIVLKVYLAGPDIFFPNA